MQFRAVDKHLNLRYTMAMMLRLRVAFLLCVSILCNVLLGPAEHVLGVPLSAMGPTVSAARKRADGAELLYAPRTPASAQNPAFAPDGATLLFTLFSQGYSAGPTSLQCLALQDMSSSAVFSEAGYQTINASGASWSAANCITFSSNRLDTNEIWYMQSDGTTLTRVTRHTWSTPFVAPTYSPDGSWIVFEVDSESGADKQGSIWKVRTDGAGLIRLTNGPGQGSDDRQPQCSPRGDRILFQRRAAGGVDWNLFTMNPEGGDVRPVTTSPAADTDASWSPDGKWIVYSSNTDGLALPSLFIVAADGGAPVRLTHDDASVDSTPVWSPDGQWIAFSSRSGLRDELPASLWRIAVPQLAPDATSTPTPAPSTTATRVPTQIPTPTPTPTPGITLSPSPTLTRVPTTSATPVAASSTTLAWTWSDWMQAMTRSSDFAAADSAGLNNASLEQWLSLRSAVASVCATTFDKPSWVLSGVDLTRQGMQRLGLALVEGVSIVAPGDLHTPGGAGAERRDALMDWIAAHQAELYGGESAAQVALVYSPRNSDLFDASASLVADESPHVSAFRAVAGALYRAHIPCDVVLDTDLAALQGPALDRPFQYGRAIARSQSYAPSGRSYSVLILPEIQAMSEDTAAVLRFSGSRLITIGTTGLYDELLHQRVRSALAGAAQLHLTAVNASLPTWVDDNLLSTDAPESVQMSVRTLPQGLALVLVNMDSSEVNGFRVDLRLNAGQTVAAAHFSAPSQDMVDVPFRVTADGRSMRLDIPMGLDTLGLVSIISED